MRTFCFRIFVFYIVSVPFLVSGQNKNKGLNELKLIANELKTIKNMSYRYSLSAHYQNSDTDQVKGLVYVNNDKKLLFNDNNAFLVIYSSHWFYKADHRNKVVTILDLEKEKNRELKKSVEKDVFGNGAIATFIDSVVMKKGILKNFKEYNDTIQIEMGFPAWMNVKSISFIYDRKNQLFASYVIRTVYASGPSKGNTGDRIEVMTCNDFSRNNDKRKYKESNYFSNGKNGLALKKYKKYKLISNL
jgi:hypothetical protein